MKQKFLLSNYNYIKKLPNEKILVWNTFTNTLLILENNEFNELLQFAGISFSHNFKLYLESGIIVKTTASKKQLEQIASQRKLAYTSKENINFRILPTTACNANCPYCYEKNIYPIHMTQLDEDNIVSFISNTAKPYKRINIFWFGGEPLLQPKTISRLTEKIISKNKEKEFYFDMTTNGILFDKNMAALASRNWHISEVQISLDGTKHIYEQTKHYNNINNAFQVIYQNISNLLNVGIHVVIRLNVSKDNVFDLISLIYDLHDNFHDKIDVYAYPLFATNFYSDLVVSKNNLATIMGDILSVLKKCGYVDSIINFKEPISCSCTSLFPNNFVILPNGGLMKCTSEIGQNILLGNVIEGVTDQQRNELWSKYTIDEECKKCCFLPICQGGCLASKICNSAIYKCCLEKYMLDGLIDRFYTEELM